MVPMGMIRTLQIVRKMRRRARGSRSDMVAYQTGVFRDLVRYAWDRSPYYRALYSDHGVQEEDLGEITPLDLPIVTKASLMEHFDEVVTDRLVKLDDIVKLRVDRRDDPTLEAPPPLRPYVIMSTSGTTGEPATLLNDQVGWRTTQVAFALRLIHRKGRRLRVHRRAFCGGSFHMAAGAQLTRHRPRFSTEPLILSTQEPLDRTVERLNAFQPTLLTGFSSRVALLAREQLSGRLRIDPEVVGTSGENLSEAMEDDMERAWPGRQVNAYSASESLCSMGRRYREPFSVYDDLNLLEILDSQNLPVAVGETGSVVLTNLHNRIMPLIRYRMADLATWGGEPEVGPFSVVHSIMGREKDAIPVIRDDGTRDEIISVAFAGFVDRALRQFKVMLTAPDLIEAHYVATSNIDEAVAGRIFRVLKKSNALKRMRVKVKRVDHLAADPKTGKVRFTEVLCNPDDPATPS